MKIVSFTVRASQAEARRWAQIARYLGCRSVSAWLFELADEQSRRVESTLPPSRRTALPGRRQLWQAPGARVDYAMLIKEFGSEGGDEQRRHAPPRLIGAEKITVSGAPVRWGELRGAITMRSSESLTVRSAADYRAAWIGVRPSCSARR